ncbi:MAG: heavy metal-associated domain-containing protein [Candidatus Calescibacterium sp.]|jgi:copper chaperone CopZ|nr:heavy metal-associated domain-containing protein [Candidatus Calescibacterium sp.]
MKVKSILTIATLVVAGVISVKSDVFPCGGGKTHGPEVKSAPTFMSPVMLMSAESETIEKTIKVEGMECANCAKSIERSVKKVNGIIEVKADYKSGTCKIKAKKDVNMEEVFKAIEKAGFKPVGEI